MNKISVVIPALNEEKYLPHLLASLADQTRKDFDVVVVDGCSKDKTVEVARSFGARLAGLAVIAAPRACLPLQRNLGARATHGEWLVFLDSDTRVQPYFVERLEAFIAERQPKLFTSWFRPDSEGSSDAFFTLIADLFVEGSLILHRPIAPGPLAVVRREVFELVGGYNEALTFGEDYDLTERITARGVPLQILRETLYVLSLRRIRKVGRLRSIGFYAYSGLLVLLTRKNLVNVPSYVMGGQFYEDEKKPPKRPPAPRKTTPA